MLGTYPWVAEYNKLASREGKPGIPLRTDVNPLEVADPDLLLKARNKGVKKFMDVVKKNGNQIRTEQLARELGCTVVEISALKGDGIQEAAEAAIAAAASGQPLSHLPAHSPPLHSPPLQQSAAASGQPPLWQAGASVQSPW